MSICENLKTYDDYKSAFLNKKIVFKHIPIEFRTNEIYEIVVKHSGHYLVCVPEKFRTKKICEIAIKKDNSVLCYVPEHLRTEEMCNLAVKHFGYNIVHVPKELRTEELCNLAVKTWPDAELYAPIGTSAYNNYMMKKALL